MSIDSIRDFYELTMSYGYFNHGYKDRICYFDVFYRRCPDNGGFAVCAGLSQVIDYLQHIKFDDEDIEYFLGLCNSSLINWFFKKLSTNSNVNGYEVDNLPIIVAQDDKKDQLKNIVKSLLNGSTEHSEDELNAVVYEIYGLTKEEIAVVEATIK